MNLLKLNKTANELYSKSDFHSALKVYKRMLDLSKLSDLKIVYYNIGLCHYSMMNYRAAEKSFEKSFDLGYLYCGHELSMTKLHLGKLEEGLSLYKWRYYAERFSFPKLPIKKAENLSDLRDKGVFVLNEQGFGDELLFSRSIRMLSNISKFTKYQVYEEMLDIFEKNFKFSNIEFFCDRNFNFDFIKDYDCWIPSGDLFSIYTMEFGFDYLKIDISDNTKPNTIGLCWLSNNLSPNSHLRSINPDDLKFLKSDNSVISLQKDKELDWIINSKIVNFNDTIDLISSVESVYSVDTSILHLSLLTGKDTKLLYKNYIDWRWKYPFYENLDKLKIHSK
jgi:hypothetical protein